MSIQAFPFQTEAVEGIHSAMKTERGVVLIGIVGCGKTYIMGKYLSEAFNRGDIQPVPGSMCPPVLYISLKPVVPQTQRVLTKEFSLAGDKVLCLTYPNLRSPAYRGLFFQEETYYEGMEEKIKYEWKESFFPRLVVIDEPQALRNPTASITQLLFSLYRRSPHTKFLNMGYTPFIKPIESRWCCLSAGLRTVPGSIRPETVLKEKDFNYWVKKVSGGNPNSLNSAAVERIKNSWGKSYVLVKGVKFKKRVMNRQLIIPFACQQHRDLYDQAWQDYLEELDKAGKLPPADQALQKAIALLKLQKRAEAIRAAYLVTAATEAIKQGKAPIIAIKYHDTVELLKIALSLHPEIKASFIIGGQTDQERQENIDAFQTGKTHLCIITIGAGGTGLSLHHNDDNKDLTKPREVYMSPAFNAIDVAQTAGRAHRLTSISTTYQYLLYFKDTVEEYVSAKLAKKLNCMSKLIAKGESWADMFVPKDKLGRGVDMEGLKEKTDSEDNLIELEGGDFMDQDEEEAPTLIKELPAPSHPNQPNLIKQIA